MDPFLITSLVFIITGASILGSVITYLYQESQAVGVWISPDDYKDWQTWREFPRLGEGLGRSIGDAFMKDRSEIRGLRHDLSLKADEVDEANHLIDLLRGRIDVLVTERDYEARRASQKIWTSPTTITF